jgi:hypothetical protein
MRYTTYLFYFVLMTSVSNVAIAKANPPNLINLSEKLIDAFYSYDKKRLESTLTMASDSIPSIVFYQGWAEGGNYKIVKRSTCIEVENDKVSCSIKVQDDLMLALGIDFNVTDTFTMTFSDGNIVKVDTSSNDLDVFWMAREWVQENHPELINLPCKGIWDGGPTPGDCVRAMVEGYKRFADSEDFPKH